MFSTQTKELTNQQNHNNQPLLLLQSTLLYGKWDQHRPGLLLIPFKCSLIRKQDTHRWFMCIHWISLVTTSFFVRVLKGSNITIIQLLNLYIQPRRRKKLKTDGGGKCTFCYLRFLPSQFSSKAITTPQRGYLFVCFAY